MIWAVKFARQHNLFYLNRAGGSRDLIPGNHAHANLISRNIWRKSWKFAAKSKSWSTSILQNTFKSPIVFAAKSKSWSTLYVRIPLKMLDKKFIKDLKVARATTKDRLNLPALIKTLLLLKIKTKCATTCKALYNLIWMLKLLCFFKILSYRRFFYMD